MKLLGVELNISQQALLYPMDGLKASWNEIRETLRNAVQVRGMKASIILATLKVVRISKTTVFLVF